MRLDHGGVGEWEGVGLVLPRLPLLPRVQVKLIDWAVLANTERKCTADAYFYVVWYLYNKRFTR